MYCLLTKGSKISSVFRSTLQMLVHLSITIRSFGYSGLKSWFSGDFLDFGVCSKLFLDVSSVKQGGRAVSIGSSGKILRKKF